MHAQMYCMYIYHRVYGVTGRMLHVNGICITGPAGDHKFPRTTREITLRSKQDRST